jgi:hypothetical protein
MRAEGMTVAPAERQRLRLAAVLGTPPGNLLEESHREEVPQAVDAGIIRRVTILLVELAEAAVAIAAELVETAFVAGIVDGRGDARGALGRDQDVVVRRVLRRKLHYISAYPDARRSLTR